MKCSRTIFDRQAEKSAEEDADMLLRKYNTEIFDPLSRELDRPGKHEIDVLMERTKMFRPSSASRKCAFPFRQFACAASFLVVCGLAFFALKTGSSPENGLPEVPGGQFRGVAPAGQPNSAQTPAREMDPLAYLVDTRGKIEIEHADGSKNVPASCEVLHKGDIVVLAGDAKGKIMYPDAFFDIADPGRYKIADPDPEKIGTEKEAAKRLEPTITTRGMHLGLNNAPPMVMPPKTLLASAVAPITRAGNEAIDVFSPKGASFTDRPIVRIGGDPRLTYTVAVLDLEGAVLGRTVSMNGGTQRAWSDFSAAPIEEDEIYTLRIQLNGKIVNDINNASFWRLSKQDRERISVILKHIGSVDSEQERSFFQANTLYMNGCYAEAYSVMDELHRKNPDNKSYSNLNALCKISLKIK